MDREIRDEERDKIFYTSFVGVEGFAEQSVKSLELFDKVIENLYENDYDKVNGDSFVSIEQVVDIKPNSFLTLKVNNLEIKLTHTLNDTQIEWFKSGSAVNFIKKSLNN